MNYESRSWTSRLVMRLTDLLFPRRGANCAGVPVLSGEVVISSLSGLGDLIIQLPLIDALYRHYTACGCRVKVALRPNHLALGSIMGWDCIAFESPVTSLFKKGKIAAVSGLFKLIFSPERRRADWWIDLTGNAVNNCLIRGFYTRKLIASGLRGGGGFAAVELPEDAGCNVYERMRIFGKFFGVELDEAVLSRKVAAGSSGRILLVLSTPCRWRNWPLKNYLELIKSLPDRAFIVSGFRHEIEDFETLNAILACPNVESALDNTDLKELLTIVSGSIAVITPDTSVAHIANRLGCCGVVLFGPENTSIWHNPYGKLRLLEKRDCSYYPCDQWHCRNRENWCMAKITPAMVLEELNKLGKD